MSTLKLRVHYQIRDAEMKTIDEMVCTFNTTLEMHQWEEGREETFPSQFLHKQSLEYVEE